MALPLLIRRHRAKRQKLVASFFPELLPAGTLPPPPPRQATYSGAGDPTSLRSSSRLPAASAPPSGSHPVRGSTPHRPQAGLCGTPPPLAHPCTAPKAIFPSWLAKSFSVRRTHTLTFRRGGKGVGAGVQTVAIKLGWKSGAREGFISSSQTHPSILATSIPATHTMEKDPGGKQPAGTTSYSFKMLLQMHTHTPLSGDSSPPLVTAATR